MIKHNKLNYWNRKNYLNAAFARKLDFLLKAYLFSIISLLSGYSKSLGTLQQLTYTKDTDSVQSPSDYTRIKVLNSWQPAENILGCHRPTCYFQSSSLEIPTQRDIPSTPVISVRAPDLTYISYTKLILNEIQFL